MRVGDYLPGRDGLPPSNVLKLHFCGGDVSGSVVVRPSGTEPEPRAYISVTAEDRAAAEAVERRNAADLDGRIG